MIFVTVGAQMPFNRLIRAVDAWAGRTGRQDLFAQIGSGEYKPKHMKWTRFIKPGKFRQLFQDADAIVAHAGTGTILTALELGKPILVMPRRGDLQETRNDHQVATAKRFEEQGRVAVAYDEHSLILKLDELACLKPSNRIGTQASPELLERLRTFINSV
ncbi:MAG: glucuronosyltransferase [Planctomycetota bacterium]|nr:MAG: glucuronosyltransferase [Planctomycetota bacterium]